MHILSGIVLSFLLKNRLEGKNKPQGFRNIIEIVHNLPGRIRYRVPVIGRKDKAETLAASLTKIRGINSIVINPVSLSVLLTYDTAVLTPDLLTAVIIQILELDNEIEKDPVPLVGKEFKELVRSLNRGVYETSNGFLDLYTIVPFSLIAVGLIKAVKTRQFSTPTSLTLLWWAYQTFFVSGKRHD